MNERIKEIAKDAGVLGDWGEDASEGRFFITGNTKQMEKFAELIIRECLEQIYSVTIDNPTDDWDQGYDSGLEQAADTIKTHFGVSE